MSILHARMKCVHNSRKTVITVLPLNITYLYLNRVPCYIKRRNPFFIKRVGRAVVLHLTIDAIRLIDFCKLVTL